MLVVLLRGELEFLLWSNFLIIFLPRIMGTAQLYSLAEQNQWKCTAQEKEVKKLKSQKQHGVIGINPDSQSFSDSGSRASLAALI